MTGAARLFLVAATIASMRIAGAARAADPPRTVYLPSADAAKTELVAYAFEPAGPGPHPAVVLLHGRGGPYSSRVSGTCTRVGRGVESPCDAATLSMRHRFWGEHWAARGYLALLVDSFGPRDRAHGYGRGTHGDPDRAAVDEIAVRPLDAEGALAWLAARAEVAPSRILLQGWSNGGSTVLNVLARQAARPANDGLPRFRGALAFYPGCGPAAVAARRYAVDVPLRVWLAADDEEVSPAACRRLLAPAAAAGPQVEVTTLPGATHDFDDPGASRQGLAANRAARDTAVAESTRWFDALR